MQPYTYIQMYLCMAWCDSACVIYRLCCVLHVQGKHDRLASSKDELETKLTEMANRNDSLETQHDNEAKKCRLMEVTSTLLS